MQSMHRVNELKPALAAALAALVAIAPGGCGGDGSDRAPAPAPAPGTAETVDASPATIVRVPAEAADRELQQAMNQARATAGAARSRWLAAPPEERRHWAVKWAAPTADGSIEHVWVRPAAWSRFRVEGVLESEPVHDLASGHGAGDLVSFPFEELSDWVRADPAGPREGGFTLEVLERRADESAP
jgi:uncharacterized protein YegJ (DUF2314 family)